MEARIIKGTGQIGGCITEITSDNGTKIIIDFGEDLPIEDKNDKIENPMIDGLTTGSPKYDAVFITHSHGDHIGLINYVLDDIPVYVESESKKIYDLLATFTYKNSRKETLDIEFEKPITIHDMIVTLYIVDHSSYNSGMILVESNGKRILHSGDYRNHGRKGKIFKSILEKIGSVDLLITEGTSFSREDIQYETEVELEKRATEIFEKYNQVFLLQSSTNIDRIVSFYKACRDTGKVFIEDIFTSNVTSILDSHIPNPKTFQDVYSWVSLKYMRKDKDFKEKFIQPFDKYCVSSVVYKDFGMMVKNTMLDDLKKFKNELGVITNACLVFSMWEGYLKRDSFKEFIDGAKELGIDFEIIHTSGHADTDAIKLLVNTLRPKKIVPIHTTNKEKAKELFGEAVYLAEDNEYIEV